MKIDEFCATYGGNTRNIDDVLRSWQITEVDGLLRTLEKQHDQIIGSAVIAGDALLGDGMLDQIPHELNDAFASLMREKADTYAEMRQILLDHVRDENGEYLSLDSRRVAGFISKIKGQIGENLFQHHIGNGAQLATSVVQEGWDVSVPHQEGLDYIQVKLYANPHDVVRHMLEVQRKVLAGTIKGVDHETPVPRIFFAVPVDAKDEVQRLAENHPGLSDMIYDKTIPIDAHGAAGIVSEGLSNVGPDQLNHFFNELLGGALAAGSLHAAVNGFLWYKGSKELSAAFASAAASAAISTTGIGMSLVAESLCHAAILSGAVGIGSRLLLGRMARSRWNFAEFLEKSMAGAEARAAALQQLHTLLPATG